MEQIIHLQGDESSPLTPLILIHAISGFALPYLSLGPLSGFDLSSGRPVYGVSSPMLTSPSHKLSYTPNSLSSLAAQYVATIRREIQPSGPYLLGGWSMGGMIAMEMASILQQQGEEVLHVIMIDSSNPTNYPKFLDRDEHEVVSRITYNAIAKRLGARTLSVNPLTFQDPADGVVSEDSSEAELSDEDEDGPNMDLEQMLVRMRKHIQWGLSLLANSSGPLSRSKFDQLSDLPVTLIKCRSTGHISSEVRDARRKFIKRMNHDVGMGWPKEKFGSFTTLGFGSTHDGCFDPTVVGELTQLIRGVLHRVDA